MVLFAVNVCKVHHSGEGIGVFSAQRILLEL